MIIYLAYTDINISKIEVKMYKVPKKKYSKIAKNYSTKNNNK